MITQNQRRVICEHAKNANKENKGTQKNWVSWLQPAVMIVCFSSAFDLVGTFLRDARTTSRLSPPFQPPSSLLPSSCPPTHQRTSRIAKAERRACAPFRLQSSHRPTFAFVLPAAFAAAASAVVLPFVCCHCLGWTQDAS